MDGGAGFFVKRCISRNLQSARPRYDAPIMPRFRRYGRYDRLSDFLRDILERSLAIGAYELEQFLSHTLRDFDQPLDYNIDQHNLPGDAKYRTQVCILDDRTDCVPMIQRKPRLFPPTVSIHQQSQR